MAMAYPLPVTAAQVGTYFVGQYYQMLQNQPEFVHQFYSDSSTMLRIEGNRRETAGSMLQIHQLVMSLSCTGIEIKIAHSLESWNGGVLVMVSGSVHVKGYNGGKKFVETFFLAPQEKGYFILNDIFHYIDKELVLQHPIAYLPQGNLDQKIHSPTIVREQVSNYVMVGDIQSMEFTAPAKIEENDPINSYNYQEEHIQQVPETEKILEENFAIHSNGSLQGTMNSVPDHLSPPVEEPAMEPQKHTYASILQVKGQSAPVVISQPSFNKPTTPDWQHGPEIPSQPSAASSNQIEKSGTETFEETIAVEDEVEVKSVYVRNVPTTMSASEIGEEFKKFGKLRQDGVAIRTRKDIDVCYAFVEYEDISGVQNAIKASVVNIGGYELYIEGRRPNRNNSIRGGRARGRGRISYAIEGTRGRFGGRGLSSRVSNQDGFERPYSRPRGNGFYRQERPYATTQQGSSNGNHYSE